VFSEQRRLIVFSYNSREQKQLTAVTENISIIIDLVENVDSPSGDIPNPEQQKQELTRQINHS